MPLTVVSVKQPAEMAYSGNPLSYLFAFSPYGTTERAQDIRLQVRVMVEQSPGSGIYNEVRAQTYTPDNDGNVSLDVQSVVDPYLEYLVPGLALKKPVAATAQCKRYRISYRAFRDGVLLINGETAVRYAAKGGYEWGRINNLNEVGMLHFTDFNTPPVVHKEDPHYLFLIGKQDYGDCTMSIEVLYDNWLMSAINGVATINVRKGAIWCLPAGFNLLQLAQHVPSGSAAFQYRIIFRQVSNNITLFIRYYNIEQRNFYNTHTLLYRNSLGGLETLRLRGQVEMDADYSQQQAQRTVAPAYLNQVLQAQTVHTSSEEVQKFKGDTGFIAKKTAESLRDFFLSAERWEVKDGRLCPIEIQAKNTKFYANNDSLFSIQIEWMNTFVNEFYTPAGVQLWSSVCPALDLFLVTQANKNTLQVQWAMPEPWDRLMLQLVVEGSDPAQVYLTGNAGNKRVSFSNPAGKTQILVQGRVVCDLDSVPPSFGAWTNRFININVNSPVVATADNYTIASGYNSAVTLQGSVLANDYDPDGDPIEAVAASGATNAGGTYSINAAGIVTYTPPSAAFSGADYFDYQAREVGGSSPVTARVNITVGGNITAVYVKRVLRNIQGYGTWQNAEAWFDFFQDAAGVQPVDVTGLGLTINYNENATYRESSSGQIVGGNTESKTIAGSSTKVKVHDGTIFTDNGFETWSLDFQITAGSGYSIIS